MARKLVLFTSFSLLFNTPLAAERDFTAARESMSITISALAKTINVPSGSADMDDSVLSAMRHIPRHEFVPDHVRAAAYENRPLPIGYGQTISQPYIVALMTELAKPRKDHVVLEIGTGSGYQAAVLSPLVRNVFSRSLSPSPAERRSG